MLLALTKNNAEFLQAYIFFVSQYSILTFNVYVVLVIILTNATAVKPDFRLESLRLRIRSCGYGNDNKTKKRATASPKRERSESRSRLHVSNHTIPVNFLSHQAIDIEHGLDH